MCNPAHICFCHLALNLSQFVSVSVVAAQCFSCSIAGNHSIFISSKTMCNHDASWTARRRCPCLIRVFHYGEVPRSVAMIIKSAASAWIQRGAVTIPARDCDRSCSALDKTSFVVCISSGTSSISTILSSRISQGHRVSVIKSSAGYSYQGAFRFLLITSVRNPSFSTLISRVP